MFLKLKNTEKLLWHSHHGHSDCKHGLLCVHEFDISSKLQFLTFNFDIQIFKTSFSFPHFSHFFKFFLSTKYTVAHFHKFFLAKNPNKRFSNKHKYKWRSLVWDNWHRFCCLFFFFFLAEEAHIFRVSYSILAHKPMIFTLLFLSRQVEHASFDLVASCIKFKFNPANQLERWTSLV